VRRKSRGAEKCLRRIVEKKVLEDAAWGFS
jgi:hypothetical protein